MLFIAVLITKYQHRIWWSKVFLQITPLGNILKNALLRCLIIFYYYKVEELHC